MITFLCYLVFEINQLSITNYVILLVPVFFIFVPFVAIRSI